MNKQQILSTIRELAKSQGLYGRLLEHIQETPEYLEFLEKMKFSDPLDLILYIES